MNRLFLSLLSLNFCGLFAQSSESLKEKYPDDMYTEINGKEVRVNTLPKSVIDSLEALPPAKKIFAIYKVEKVDRAIEQNQPAETYSISEFDYWLDKRVERIYSVYRNGDGTTRIEDNSGNWMLFNTEYEVNEYTGEKSSTPINGKTYCGFGGKKDVVLLAAHRILPNGYRLDVDSYNKTITMTYMPLGVSYVTKKNRVLSRIWYEWISESNFQSSFNMLYNKDNCMVKGPTNEILIDCTNMKFKDFGGRETLGGLYNKRNHFMYYVHKFGKNNNNYDYHNGYVMKVYPINKEAENNLDSYILQNSKDYADLDSINAKNANNQKKLPAIQNEISKLKKERDQLKKDYDIKQNAYKRKNDKLNQQLYNEYRADYNSITQKISQLEHTSSVIYANRKPIKTITTNYNVKGVILLPCIPTDKIKEVKIGDKVSEMYYENGDYIKISKIKNGEVFDCRVHRPNGLWTVTLDNNVPVSKFVFTKGRYKGLVCNDKFEGSNYASCLTVLDMLDYRMFKSPGYNQYSFYEPRLFDPSKNRWLTVYSNTGEIKEYLEEAKAKREAVENAQKKKLEQEIYATYCKKYGKTNIDNIFRCRIPVGMPFSVIKDLCYTELTDEIGATKWYRVFYAGSKYDHGNKKLVPIDVRYAPKAIVSYWLISVSNGTVRSAHVMKVY